MPTIVWAFARKLAIRCCSFASLGGFRWLEAKVSLTSWLNNCSCLDLCTPPLNLCTESNLIWEDEHRIDGDWNREKLPLSSASPCPSILWQSCFGGFHMPRLCDGHREFSLPGWLTMREGTRRQCEGLCDCELVKIENHNGSPLGTPVREWLDSVNREGELCPNCGQHRSRCGLRSLAE